MSYDDELRAARRALTQARTAIPTNPLAQKDTARAVPDMLDALEHLTKAVEALASRTLAPSRGLPRHPGP